MQTLPANTTVKALPSVAGTAGKPAAPYLQRWASINYERRTMKKKTKYWIAAAACVLLAMYFFMWTIQTAWLGSFPGRDIELYTRWTYMQLAASIAFLVAAIASFVKAWRIRE